MHCAVPFFCARSGTEGEAAWRCGEWVVRSAENASRSLRACVGAAGARGGLRRGVGCEVGGRASRSLRNASRSLRACVGAAWGSGSAREGRVAVRGRAKVFGGEWVVRSAGLTHICRSRSRARVLLYIRPPCPRREIAAMGPKDAPCEHPSPANDFRTRPVRVCTSAPAFTLPPSAFTLPPHSLPLPPRSNRPPAAAVIHNGLSTEKLSTSLPAALCKTCSPSRLRTRIYNISFARRLLPGSVRAAPEKSPRRCATVSRAAVCRVGEGEGKGGRLLVQCRTCRLCAESLCTKTEVHQANPAPARAFSPRQPAYGRAPARLCAESLCAKAEVHKANPAPARALSPRQLVYRRAPPACVPNHCAQRRKCTRQSPPLPVRSPRGNLSTAPPPQAGGKTTEWRTAAPQRPHIERSAETILAQFAYQDAKAHKALCTICIFRLHALQAFAQLFHSLAQIAPLRTEKSTNRRPKA